MPDIFYWLLAAHIEGLGSARLQQCLDQFGDIKHIFSASRQDLQSLPLNEKLVYAITHPDWQKAENDFAWCNKNTCHIIPFNDKHYPHLLRETAGAPFLLFVRGDITLLREPQLAMVGSRNPTASGSELAEQFAYYLAEAGLAITSGLALGIDAASHRGALFATGKTIAILGSGLGHIYPASHRKLAEDIMLKGALVSEFSPHSPPKAIHFPMRNRIISGLSLGVLVIEAALKSGSLITAHYAIEQGREVFALPGSIHNPLARGCHQLIRQGAKLVEKVEDILEELGALQAASSASPVKSIQLDDIYQHVLAQIGYETTALDAIIFRSGLTAEQVSSMLITLELEGYARAAPGGYVRNL